MKKRTIRIETLILAIGTIFIGIIIAIDFSILISIFIWLLALLEILIAVWPKFRRYLEIE